MELTLNLVWLIASLVALIWCGARRKVAPEARKRSAALLAWLCVAAVLFPVISMSDDMTGIPAVVEGGKLKSLSWSDQVVVALLQWVLVQNPHEHASLAVSSELGRHRGSQELLTFQLLRRPPPALSLA